MEIENKQRVWLIEDNEIKYKRTIISSVFYKDLEVIVLKSDINNLDRQEVIIKDKRAVLWKLYIAPIKYQFFLNADKGIATEKELEYCEDIYNVLSNIDLKTFFTNKIDRQEYFNKVQLEYLADNFPDLLSKAIQCRENHIQKIRQEQEIQKEEKEQKNKEKVEKVNGIFKNKIKDLKEQILWQKRVDTEYLDYYKDDNYHNGLTTQNCFLYLAKEYGIDIPLATQGFINQKLVAYNFATDTYTFRVKGSNKKGSTKVCEYMYRIREKVKEEYIQEKNKLEKVKER